MCIRSLGAAEQQPAYVAEDAPLDLFPGHCLCESAHLKQK